MPNAKNSIEINCAIADPAWAATMLRDQYAALPASICRSRAELLLNDGYALGYAYGFSAQASRHSNGPQHDERGPKYIESVFANLLEDTQKAASFVAFARFQRDDHSFVSGYNPGVMDLNDWVFSRGSAQPNGLIERYQ